MAKKTAVIDIGSNSARMAIYEKTSQFGFHLLKEIKSRVRISEHTYENGGYLQPVPMDRAMKVVKEFMLIANALKVRKTLCVATSAVRDAPNKKEFISRFKKETGVNMKVIDGQTEAYFGAVAALNLLPIDEGVTVDIGGGSTEFALIRDRKIIERCSLNIGTIRLKELFYDHKRSVGEAVGFIEEELVKLPDTIRSKNVIGIGGTVRAMSKAIMREEKYPLDTLHGYEINVEEYADFYQAIYATPLMRLTRFGIREERLDTIREGALIFSKVLRLFDAKKVITCGVGVREGVYLHDLLRNHNGVFPKGFNPSVRSLLDRYGQTSDQSEFVVKASLEIFDALRPRHRVSNTYKYHLRYAARLSNIGDSLDYYGHHHHGEYFIANGLKYGFTHEDRVLIALLVKYHGKKIPGYSAIEGKEKLYPDIEALKWLSFILSVAECVNSDLSGPRVRFSFSNETLYIESDNELYLAKEMVKKLSKPAPIALVFCYKKAL